MIYIIKLFIIIISKLNKWFVIDKKNEIWEENNLILGLNWWSWKQLYTKITMINFIEPKCLS